MRLRMKSTAAGPGGVLAAGEEVVVSDELGAVLVEMGYAEALKDVPETTATAPPETTAKPAPKRRTRSRAKKES